MNRSRLGAMNQSWLPASAGRTRDSRSLPLEGGSHTRSTEMCNEQRSKGPAGQRMRERRAGGPARLFLLAHRPNGRIAGTGLESRARVAAWPRDGHKPEARRDPAAERAALRDHRHDRRRRECPRPDLVADRCSGDGRRECVVHPRDSGDCGRPDARLNDLGVDRQGRSAVRPAAVSAGRHRRWRRNTASPAVSPAAGQRRRGTW